MYRPELDIEQKRLIYAAFAACVYPKGLDYGNVQSDGSPHSDDEVEGEYGERWISVPADAHATSRTAGRKKRTRKGKKNTKESITFVRVQDFFTRTPGAFTQVHPWDLVLVEDVALGYPSLAVVKKLWQTPAGKVEAQVTWMYRLSDLPKGVQQAAQCEYPPKVGKRCAVKRAESEQWLPEIGCMRELLFSDHSDVIEAKDIVHIARAFFLGRDEEDPVQHVGYADINITVAIPGQVCRRLFRSREQRVCWLEDADLPAALRKEAAHLMSATKIKLQDEAIRRPYVADIAQLAPPPELEAS